MKSTLAGVGVWRASCLIASQNLGQAPQYQMQALLNGVEKAQSEGYKYVAWRGPAPMSVTQTQSRYGVVLSSKTFTGYQFLAVGLADQRGNARPIPQVIAEIKARIAGQAPAAMPAPTMQMPAGTPAMQDADK